MIEQQNILPCGRVVWYDQYDTSDIAARADVYNCIIKDKKKWEDFFPFKNVGKSKKRYAHGVYSKFVTLLLRKTVDHLMQSDRISTFDDHHWAIAGAQDPKGAYKDDWATDGRTFGVVIMGMHTGKFKIKLSRRRKMELARRLESGQKFYEITHPITAPHA